MKRRVFVRNLSASALLLGVSGWSSAFTLPKKGKHITILHTNDTHSHIDSFPPNDPRYAGRGGVAQRAVLIEKIRKENPNTLLLDAGDIFQGTPYFNYYGGALEFKLMSMLGYDAATLGNHDFDNGLEGLLAQLPLAQFDFLSANYDFSNTILEGRFKPYKIFHKDGVKIGVFGIGVELAGLVDKKMYKETRYLDPLDVAQQMETLLKKDEKCDIVICLSHLGYSYRTDQVSDIKIAENTSFIDLIIGGHTHTFLDKPTVVTNRQGVATLVNQVGCFGLNLGRIDFFLDSEKPLENRNINI